MIKKQDLILKINKILNKLNKDKLINFYNIFINKKGGSLRNLCYHLNTTISDKEVRDKRAIITDRKIVIPQRYTLTPRNLLIEFIKDIIIITSILKKNMIDEYDNLKTRNQELKYKFVCYTYYMHDDIRKLDTNHFDLISYFMEFYLNKDKKKHTISKIGNSNRLRIKTDNGITIDVIYTKDYQRINLVMYLEEISEKKRKEYFDQFEECYYSPQQQFTTTNQFKFQPYTYEQQRPVVKTRILLDDNTLLSRVGQQQGQQQPQLKFGFTGPQKEIEDEMKKLQDYLHSFITKPSDRKKYSSEFDELKKQFELLVGIDKKISEKSKMVDTDNLRKLYDTLYNKFIDYLYSKYLYELNLIIDDQNIANKKMPFDNLNSNIDKFGNIDEDKITISNNYNKAKEERKKYDKYLNIDMSQLTLSDKNNLILISLIIEKLITYSNLIDFSQYLAVLKLIFGNYELYKIYIELSNVFDNLFKLKYVEYTFIGNNTEYNRLQPRYKELCSQINKYIDEISVNINDLLTTNQNDDYLQKTIINDTQMKRDIYDIIQILSKNKYKYHCISRLINSLIRRTGNRIYLNFLN